ncbi:hypothetical protein IGI04_016650 [Brassica rapa subsp. trilocularis]|nr:hypothetical protein IGI04_016650 [Brassica rapa subsp. trilocularis]
MTPVTHPIVRYGGCTTGTWDHNLVRQLIDEEDVNLVLNTKINLSRADKLIWGFSKNANILEKNTKPAIFLFLIAALSEYVNLRTGSGSVCGQDSETICHVLFHCKTAKEVWDKSRFPLPSAGWSQNSDTAVWLNLHDNLPTEEYSTMFRGSVPEKWQKPPASFLKCNVGSSLDEGSSIAGAAWVVRDARGIVLLHSRRAFANVSSLQQANVMALHWAAEAMSDLKLKKVVFEFSALEVKKAMDHPLLCFGHFQPVSHALSAIYSIRDAKISYVTSSCNLIANLIAVSVTRDQRYQSYVARNGPAWLATQIGQEASA